MMRCHGQREGMMKTLELMRATKKPKILEKKGEPLNLLEEKFNNEIKKNPEPRQWEKDIDGSWVYANSYKLIDSWIYREDTGWLWSFDKGRFLFSEKYGWLYNSVFRHRRLFYWYDRRGWVLPKDLSKLK